MHRLYRPAAAGLLLAATAHAAAQNGPSTAPEAPAAPEGAASAPASAAAGEARFEGALGLVLTSKPAFSGSSDRQLSPRLAGFVRYGRFTVTGAGGFTTRRQDDVERGLDALLVRREGLRVNLSFRYDQGRSESDSPQLSGMGDIKPTIRARLGLRWEPAPYWAVGLATSTDVLGRGGGYLVDAGISRTFPLTASQRIILGASLTGAGDRYLQTWYGVSEAQSLASGYPVYKPSEGLRDVGLTATWRMEIDPQWAGFVGVGTSRLLGPAADSPLTTNRNGTSVSAGIARRF